MQYQNGGTYGYNVKQLEQSNGGVFSGYATGPYGVENGNLGEYSSSYSLPHRVQNENRFGASSSQLPVSGMGQYMAGPYNHRVQPDTPVAVTVGTTGTEFSSSPVTGDYEKRTKHF